MAKKKTSKKAAKKTKKKTSSRRPQTGQRRGAGREMKAINLKLPVELIEWIDDQADTWGYSRTMMIEKMLSQHKAADKAVEEMGLFDDFRQRFEQIAEDAIKRVTEK